MAQSNQNSVNAVRLIRAFHLDQFDIGLFVIAYPRPAIL